MQVKLAKEAREHAITALDLEPSSDLAHHLMGRQAFESTPAQQNSDFLPVVQAFAVVMPPLPTLCHY